MESILTELNIDFAKFYPIRLTSLELDFAIPKYKINIECDGTYWHKDRKHKDLKRDYYLKSLGWKTIRFDDTEILQKRDEIIKKLKLEIEKWKK